MIKKLILIVPIIFVTLFLLNFNNVFATDTDIDMNIAGDAGTTVEDSPADTTTSSDESETSEAVNE